MIKIKTFCATTIAVEFIVNKKGNLELLLHPWGCRKTYHLSVNFEKSETMCRLVIRDENTGDCRKTPYVEISDIESTDDIYTMLGELVKLVKGFDVGEIPRSMKQIKEGYTHLIVSSHVANVLYNAKDDAIDSWVDREFIKIHMSDK